MDFILEYTARINSSTQEERTACVMAEPHHWAAKNGSVQERQPHTDPQKEKHPKD